MSDPDTFRAETRAWLEANCPPAMRTPMAGEADICWGGRKAAFQSRDQQLWLERMGARGWTVPEWPQQYGGGGLSRAQAKILREEMARLGCRQPLHSFGIWMLGPALLKYGSEAQKQQYLPPIVRGEIRWCQGYSEPGAGSDLASLQTRAEDRGDHYLVNGQKIWTSYADKADWIFCLVRTDPAAKKQAGISFLLIDMTSPGITVRPIITIEGRHEVNEIFFDEVRVPAENLVGEENKGWTYAKYLLANERTGIARIGASKERIARIKRLARTVPAGAGTMWEDTAFRTRLTDVEIQLKALEITQMRVVAAQARAPSDKPDPASSILKIKGTELTQATTELLFELAGPQALAYQDQHGRNDPLADDDWAAFAGPTYFNHRKVSIYGGSNEIQRNIIAKTILGL
jgi:alkylation response protein AidB-like acyl-CoA dehydrogenase